MKLSTMLLASAAVMLAGSASAADLTNPFHIAEQGHFESDTAMEYGRQKVNHNVKAEDSLKLSERLSYGVTEDLEVYGEIVNAFDKEDAYNNDHNYGYTVGAAYNMQHCDWLAQVRGEYTTLDPKDFYGKRKAHNHVKYGERWNKILSAEAKLGYDMGNGLTPYASYGLAGNVDYADRWLDQSAKLGVHKYTSNWALDGAVRYDFNTDKKNSNEWWLDAEADYYPTENVALGVYGSYFVAGNEDVAREDKIKYDYTIGAHVKVAF